MGQHYEREDLEVCMRRIRGLGRESLTVAMQWKRQLDISLRMPIYVIPRIAESHSFKFMPSQLMRIKHL